MPNTTIRNYRLTSLREPTDAMLASVMKSVARTACERTREAHRHFFDNLTARIREQQTKATDKR